MDVVSAIIVNDQKQVLLAQRPSGKHLAGFWEFPGGKVESGESPEEALTRELREELSLSVKIQKYLGQFDHQYEWGTVHLLMYLVKGPVFAPAEP